jgi:protein-disulfide isomerase
VGLVAVIALIVIVLVNSASYTASTTATAPAAAVNSTEAAPPALDGLNQLDQITPVATPTPTLGEIMTFFADDDPYLGAADAPVVIVEFSDYLCPYCGNFYLEAILPVLEAYPDDVQYIHRDAPVLDETASMQASMAAGCAEEQGKFWAMHNVLFSLYEDLDLDALHEAKQSGNMEMWLEHVNLFSEENLRDMAAEAGLDLAAYDTCMAEDTRATEVVIDLQTAYQLGVRGVPAFIINGQMVGGAQPYEQLVQMVDAMLATRPIQR